MVSRVTRLTGAKVGQFRRSPGTELPNPEPREPAQLRRDWADMYAFPRRVLTTFAHWGIGWLNWLGLWCAIAGKPRALEKGAPPRRVVRDARPLSACRHHL